MPPVRPDGLLDAVHDRDPVLGDHVLDLEGLPAVRVRQLDRRSVHHQRRIHRLVVQGSVSVGLVRAVVRRGGENGLRDAGPEGGRRVRAHGARVERVAERIHEVGELGE